MTCYFHFKQQVPLRVQPDFRHSYYEKRLIDNLSIPAVSVDQGPEVCVCSRYVNILQMSVLPVHGVLASLSEVSMFVEADSGHLRRIFLLN